MEIEEIEQLHLFIPSNENIIKRGINQRDIPINRFIFDGGVEFTQEEKRELTEFNKFGNDDFKKQLSFIYYEFL